MKQYIDKADVMAEIEKLQLCTMDEDGNFYSPEAQGEYNALCKLESFIDTLEVKEIPETTQTECKKIKKLCEIQRYDEDGKVYSVMLSDTRLFMNKINDIIEAIEDLDLRLQTIEALNIDYGKCKTEILEKVRKVSHLIANKGNVNFKRIDERLRKIEQRIGG